MTIETLLEGIKDKLPPAPEEEILAFEQQIGERLPEDYRDFLVRCNGGWVYRANIGWYGEKIEDEAVEIHHVGGFRDRVDLSLAFSRDAFQGKEVRIPLDLIWIMDDPGGNLICLGISGEYRNRIYFWDHELEPEPGDWDGRMETAENLTLVANSFTEFVAGLEVRDDSRFTIT